MPRFGVTPQKENALAVRMAACGLREEDMKERFIRSGGPGGQKVNRTASCVYIKHVPSGLEVKMQKARSQSLNRFYARRRMCELLEEESLGAQSPEARRHEKIRRQKSRRRRRGKTKPLDVEGQDTQDRASSTEETSQPE